MRILPKCHLCNHFVWPWQRVSTTSASNSHFSCHKISLSIFRIDQKNSNLLDYYVSDYERRSGIYTGFKQDSSDAFIDEGFLTSEENRSELLAIKKELMARAFPDQPSHKKRAKEIRESVDRHSAFMNSLAPIGDEQ